MATIGYFLSSEEHPGSELVRATAQAEQAGFAAYEREVLPHLR